MVRERFELLGRNEQKRLETALRIALQECQRKGIDGRTWGEMLSAVRIGLVPDNLGMMKNLLKAMIGYDPLEGDTRPKGEKQPGLARSASREPPSLQDLSERIYAKAKAEPAHRFWGLYV